MINLIIVDALIEEREQFQDRSEWWVLHPMNGAVLAYCDTKEEAQEVVDRINAFAALLKMKSSR